MSDSKPIALLTDFGLQDWFVGTMKGVIRTISPQSPIIDISHHVPNQNVKAGGFVLWNAYNYFPEETVFIGVVDPGVGSDRDVLAVQTEDHFFVAPDNGLLDFVLSSTRPKKVIPVDNERYFLDDISQTFHGRDIFAPVGAHIAAGVPLSKFGAPSNFPNPQINFTSLNETGHYKGEVLYIDKFGNLITDLWAPQPLSGSVTIKNHTLPVRNTYAAAKPEQPLAVIDSSNFIEIAVRNSNAQKHFNAAFGTPVEITVTQLEA